MLFYKSPMIEIMVARLRMQKPRAMWVEDTFCVQSNGSNCMKFRERI